MVAALTQPAEPDLLPHPAPLQDWVEIRLWILVQVSAHCLKFAVTVQAHLRRQRFGLGLLMLLVSEFLQQWSDCSV